MIYRIQNIAEEELSLIEGEAYTVTTRRTRAGERILEVYCSITLRPILTLHLDDPKLFDDCRSKELAKILLKGD